MRSCIDGSSRSRVGESVCYVMGSSLPSYFNHGVCMMLYVLARMLPISLRLLYAVKDLGEFNLHGRGAHCVSTRGLAWQCVDGITRIVFSLPNGLQPLGKGCACA